MDIAGFFDEIDHEVMLKAWDNTRIEVTDLAQLLNSKLRGWTGYYGIYNKHTLRRNIMKIDERWIGKKYKLG